MIKQCKYLFLNLIFYRKKEKGMRRGYMGHILEICALIAKYSKEEKYSSLNKILEGKNEKNFQIKTFRCERLERICEWYIGRKK